MSITPEHFLSFAEKTATSNTATEFDHRNIASRAYYAAFHCCRIEADQCPTLAGSIPSGSHDRLYARFERLTAQDTTNYLELKKLAYVAKMMKAVRHLADYELSTEFSEFDARQQIGDARRVVNQWKQMNNKAKLAKNVA